MTICQKGKAKLNHLSFPSLLSSSMHKEGKLEVNMTEVSLGEVERSLLEKDPTIVPGGYWKPKDCLPRWKVSVDETLVSFCLGKKFVLVLVMHTLQIWMTPSVTTSM